MRSRRPGSHRPAAKQGEARQQHGLQLVTLVPHMRAGHVANLIAEVQRVCTARQHGRQLSERGDAMLPWVRHVLQARPLALAAPQPPSVS